MHHTSKSPTSTDNFEKLVEKVFEVDTTLPENKRATMRAFLKEYATWKPVRGASVASSRSRFFSLFLRKNYRVLVGITACALLVVSIGATAASAHTLPGDFLYPVKVNVIEPARTALTFSSEAKASWQMTIAGRRLQEAVTLSHEGTLSTTTAEQLSARFSTAADRAAVSLNASTKDTNNNVAIISATHFSATLNGYNAVLSALPATSSPSVVTLKTSIQSHLPVFATLSHIIDSSTTYSSPDFSTSTNNRGHNQAPIASYDLLDNLRKNANQSLNTSARVFAEASSSLSSEDVKVFSEKLQSSLHDRVEANHFASTHDNAHAEQLFQNVISDTTQLGILIRNAGSLNLSISPHGSATTTTSASSTKHIAHPNPTTNAAELQPSTGAIGTSAPKDIPTTTPSVATSSTSSLHATSSISSQTTPASSSTTASSSVKENTTSIPKTTNLIPSIPLLPL